MPPVAPEVFRCYDIRMSEEQAVYKITDGLQSAMMSPGSRMVDKDAIWDRLKKRWERLDKKISEFQKSYDIETRPDEKNRLGGLVHEIENTFAEIEAILDRLTKKRWIIIVEDKDTEDAEKLLAILKRLGGDGSVTMVGLDDGAIKLTLESSTAAFERIRALFESGQLDKALDAQVTQLCEQESDPQADQFEQNELQSFDFAGLLRQGANVWNAWRLEHRYVSVDLRETNLSGTNLSKADLSGANLYKADLLGANLYRTNLIGTNLIGADLRWANLREANLSGANFYRAEFIGTNLYRANLIGTNLIGAHFYRAELSGADLSRANLSNARHLAEDQIDSARGDENTVLPEGLIRPAHWFPKDEDKTIDKPLTRGEIGRLQKQWELHNDILRQLEEQRIRENRGDEKFRLEHLIQETETELNKIVQRLKFLQDQFAKTNSGANVSAGRNDDQG